jgi:hypothetical protein
VTCSKRLIAELSSEPVCMSVVGGGQLLFSSSRDQDQQLLKQAALAIFYSVSTIQSSGRMHLPRSLR